MTIIDDHRLQVEEHLRERYFPLVPQLNRAWPPEQHDRNRLSRALAAYAVEELADVSEAQAANAIIDGGDDNGIDALHFERAANVLFVVQAKIGNAPDLGECKKFTGGTSDLLNRRFHKFNAAFERLLPDVEDALDSEGATVIACTIHLGDELGPHAVTELDQLGEQLNAFGNRFGWKDLGLESVHRWLTEQQAVAHVDLSLTLEKWDTFTGTRKAVYGQVSAKELAHLYKTHGKSLLERNIRHFLGLLPVNAAIASTVHSRPGDLFFLNNGLTAVCRSLTQVLGANKDKGRFVIRNFSVVNGAQTLGSIAVAAARQQVSEDAKVLLTIIEIGDADEIGPEITRARNTQNAVRGVHFAALDPQQERLRQELAISGFTYLYRPSDEADTANPMVITVSKAAAALACLSGNTRTVVTVKREVGQLYDGSGTTYAELFRPALSGVRLARSVQIYDYAMEILFSSELAEAAYSRRKMFYRHGQPFVLHLFARRNRALIEVSTGLLTDLERATISRQVLELAERIFEVAEPLFGGMRGYLAIFRSLTDCMQLADAVMRRLAEIADATASAESLTPAPSQEQC